MNLRDSILAHLGRPDYVPEPAADLAAALDIPRRNRRRLTNELKKLEARGVITRIKNDCYCLPADADLITGRIVFRQSGSALLIPETGATDAREEPIEIAAEDTGVAMHNDRVVVRLSDRPRRRGRPPQSNRVDAERRFGRVIRILERARETITGTLQRTRLFYYVVPDDPRLVNDIYVPDPTESGIKPPPQTGDKVVAKLHEWTQRHVNPEGEIIEVLGRTHEPQAEFKAILHKFNLQPEFPEAVLRDVARVPGEVRPADRRRRLDLRNIPTITIDPDDAKDFDDALSVETLDNGDTRIGIHIADVSYYVRPGSALDREAQKRGNSTYLVGTVIPMLPHPLSSGICSLKEGVERLTKSVFLTFSSKGRLRETTFANTVIRSLKRLTYKQAYVLLKQDDNKAFRSLPMPPAHQTGFAGRAPSELSNREIAQLRKLIRTLWSIASRLRRERMSKGSLDLDMPETKVFVDEQGYADRLEKVENDESHQLIEEFMLAANEAVAGELRRANLPAIYRVHDKPDDDRLQELREFLATFGVKCGDLTVRAEMTRTLEKLRDHPQGHILRTQVLRSLKKACYRAQPDGHYGLNKRDYLHFTSPIRRYADLVVHRIFVDHLARNLGQPRIPGAKADYSIARVASIADHLSATEVNSTEAERESVKVKLLEFFERELEKRKRTRFEAVIVETRNHGMFIELTESLAFGMVHISTLNDDLYFLSRDGTALIGRRTKKRYETGQKIEVVVSRVDRFKRQIDFHVAGNNGRGAKKKGSGRDRSRSRGRRSR